MFEFWVKLVQRQQAKYNKATTASRDNFTNKNKIFEGKIDKK